VDSFFEEYAYDASTTQQANDSSTSSVQSAKNKDVSASLPQKKVSDIFCMHKFKKLGNFGLNFFISIVP
jgi:hypothetical protein